jgi:hypothetical protein
MSDFEVQLKFSDPNLAAAILRELMEIKASQESINVLILEMVAKKTKRDFDELAEQYAQMVISLREKYLADLAMDYAQPTIKP